MLSISVEEQALKRYCELFPEMVRDMMKELINPDFVVRQEEITYSFLFFSDYVLILKIQSNTIGNVHRMTYEHFISNEVVQNLSESEKLPSRLARYKRLGTERFKSEIKRSLQNGTIIADKRSVIWREYNIELQINDGLVLWPV
ncbi:hypothetical protein ABEP42_13900 [Priestia megaterium]|uniref:hypothetical protein n=1 Tax=Priestia megaterium TaxID=1404 RepID=UPI003175FA50